ncbi:fructosamine kinase family protein [Parvularcula lutaonensis]|uniref:Fructosamine kinase family protein n=1 Tax=Parvularcula lutaonensis TaxID=491923 RepID=A0ABV7MA44_9PROT|nr:fructosamine kinase family protein [Parvularcula lutaonensis]
MSWKDALPAPIARSELIGTGSSEAGITVSRHWLADGSSVVSKVASGPTEELPIEAEMLRYLSERTQLRVPEVHFSDASAIVIEWLPSGARLSGTAEHEAADALAALHGISADRYGFDWPTVIAGIPQDNCWQDDWYTFYAEQRLVPLARQCVTTGRARSDILKLTDKLAGRLPNLLDTPKPPGLVHGDLWSGNIIVSPDGFSGLIDPAIYFGDPEMDLAFGTLFGALGDGFFARYREHRPLSDDFFEVRRDIYNLWPLLVHVRLFGGHYEGQAMQVLERFAGA